MVPRRGAKCLTDTVDSRPSGNLVLSYIGFTSVCSTASAKSPFLCNRTNLRRKTGPGLDNQTGNDLRFGDRRGKLKTNFAESSSSLYTVGIGEKGVWQHGLPSRDW